ncbi:acyl carrier protein [Chitinophaga sp. Cy-1792]|uniref:acyl carrier protein n=1 Tax=Chitinophaga sp. Cy-1792 TaxID=2608339 RepID=UPI00142499CD|nr:acyl carrier protein [Chitinophaga sp. Cy-1792]NIG54496.1 acyl carrier protein [Chitinophaga sp. Cy-1792]
MAQPTESNVINTISTATGVPETAINPATTFSELGMTSILAVQLASKLENKLGVKLNLDEMTNTQTIGDLVSYIETKAK